MFPSGKAPSPPSALGWPHSLLQGWDQHLPWGKNPFTPSSGPLQPPARPGAAFLSGKAPSSPPALGWPHSLLQVWRSVSLGECPSHPQPHSTPGAVFPSFLPSFCTSALLQPLSLFQGRGNTSTLFLSAAFYKNQLSSPPSKPACRVSAALLCFRQQGHALCLQGE